ncbi:MAG: LysR family transcriptional regulator [Corticimicrobacter sp.]|uniref:LysR family transcriptional regulator n=1 Tax=Corticimicrobacter sp. TaxID=2678536 RepID=UPI0032DB4D7A
MDTTRPSLDDMALFVEIAKTKSFTRAADALHMPASTLSRRIAGLERGIGVKLLKRSTRKVELTEAGGVYFERCREIVAEAAIAHEALVEVAQQPKGELRISMPASFALLRMPTLLCEFQEKYPGIHCEIDLSIQHIDLLSDPYDIVLRFGRQPDSNVVARQIGVIDLGLYASRSYIEQHGVPQEPGDLVRHDCLRSSGGREGTFWTLQNQGRREKVAVAGKMAVNNVSMLRQLAELGMGIVPLNAQDMQIQSPGDNLVRVLPDWTFPPIPFLALFPSRMLPAKTRVFIEFLQARLALGRAAAQA